MSSRHCRENTSVLTVKSLQYIHVLDNHLFILSFRIFQNTTTPGKFHSLNWSVLKFCFRKLEIKNRIMYTCKLFWKLSPSDNFPFSASDCIAIEGNLSNSCFGKWKVLTQNVCRKVKEVVPCKNTYNQY